MTTIPTLQLLTFEDLVTLAEQRLARAQAPDKIAGWEQLLSVARGLAGAGDDELTRDRTWSLVRVRIQDYQGIGTEPLTIEFDPRPGVTVMHGANGSGKSSIADAIETALHGVPRPPTPGSGGKAPLWDRDHCGRDAGEAFVEVTVRCGEERLVLSCRIDSSGQVIERTEQHVTTSGTTDVALRTTTWHSALAGHRPVFGYAAVERQVQLASNLQEFLVPLLAFGGCFEALKNAVQEAGAASAGAKQRWHTALSSARTAVAAVDTQRIRPDVPALPNLDWPDVEDDPDQWLAASDLAETGAAVAEVTEQHHDRLHSAATAAVDALDELETAETSLLARLAGPLSGRRRKYAAVSFRRPSSCLGRGWRPRGRRFVRAVGRGRCG